MQQRPGVRVVLAAAAVTTACVFPAFLVGALALQVGRDLDFSEAGVGLAYGGFFAAAALLSAPLGRLTERGGPERSLRLAAAVSGSASLAIAVFAQTFTHLVVLLCVAGSANALCQPAANALLARATRRERQGLAFAVKQAAIPVSTLLAGVTVPAIGLTVGWRWAFGLAAAFSVGAALTVSSGLTARAAQPPADPLGPRPPARVMRTLAVGICFGAAAGGTLGSFLVTSAVDAGLSEGSAGLLLTAGSAVGIATRLVAGARADRRLGGHLRVVATMLGLGALVFLVLASGSEVAYLVGAPLAFATAWAWPGLFNLAVVRANPASPAAATGMTQTGTYIGAVAGPLLFGAIAEHRGIGTAWVVASLFAGGAALAVGIGRHRLRGWRTGLVPAPT